MNIIDAINSRKPFKRKKHMLYIVMKYQYFIDKPTVTFDNLELNDFRNIDLMTASDLMSDDWVVKDE